MDVSLIIQELYKYLSPCNNTWLTEIELKHLAQEWFELYSDFILIYIDRRTDLSNQFSFKLRRVLNAISIELKAKRIMIDGKRRRVFLFNLTTPDIKKLEQRRIFKTYETKKKKGYIYIIQSPTKAYKIGRSKNPKNRLKTFSVKLPFEVEYIALIETDDMVLLEKELHQRFADKRINGEWFELSPKDVEYIKGLQQ